MNTATLAASPTGSSFGQNGLSSDARQYVSFLIDGELFGVPVGMVQEVLNAQKIAQTPLARAEVAGLLNLRGQIVTALNLRRRLCLPDRNAYEHSMNVVVRHGGESFSLLVDDVGDVITVDGSEMEPPPRTLDARWRALVCGVIRLETALFVILDLAAVLNLEAALPRAVDLRTTSA